MSSHAFQPPTGTRDFYPQDLLRRRYIEKAWRDTALRHGFEEIDGPTFEHLDLYTVKSGEGIVSELFSFTRAGGEKTYALRPEFTPTLARMYADKAASLSKPTKWFWQQNCFRAERPQRGRLREFGQWNLDLIGDASVQADAELLASTVGLLESLGLRPQDAQVRISDRRTTAQLLLNGGVSQDRVSESLSFLDRASKLEGHDRDGQARNLGIPLTLLQYFVSPRGFSAEDGATGASSLAALDSAGREAQDLVRPLFSELNSMGIADWCMFDLSIVRGLAYYTGMVFEVTAGRERAIAGGGRYDNLIELFGGPSTPAVGFGMGDVVLSLVLQDKGLMPDDAALLEKLSEPTPYRCNVFVLSNGTPEADAAVIPVVASLRRGDRDKNIKPLHARRTYKTSKNLGKLLKDASGPAGGRARFAAILESATTCSLKNLDTGEQEGAVPVSEIAARALAASSVRTERPAS